MKKYLIFLCLLFTQIISIVAQEDDSYRNIRINRDSIIIYKREKAISDAEFIFEATMTSEDVYLRIDKNGLNHNMRSVIATITKVFRGNLKPGTVEILDELFDTNIVVDQKRESYKLHHALTHGIFLCKSNKEFPYDSKYNIHPVDNKMIITNTSVGFINLIAPTLGWYEKKFQTKGEIYQYISTLPNIAMPVITAEDTTIKISDHVFYSKTFTKMQLDSIENDKKFKIKSQQTFNNKDSLKIKNTK